MSSTKGQLYNWLLLISVLLVLVIVAVALAEASLRSLGLGDPMVYEPNAAYGYALKPEQSAIRLRDAHVGINESGLRATREWRTDQSATKVVFHGDSVTYGGSYIDDSQLFSELVCQSLERALCGNAGVNGYGVLNMVLRSRYDDRLADADVVVFTVLAGDFERGLKDAADNYFHMNEPNGWVPALEEVANFIANRYALKNYLGKRGARYDAERHQASRRKAMDFAASTLNDEVGRLRSLDKQVLVFYTPSREEAAGTYDYDKDWREVKRILASVDNIIDMTDAFDSEESVYFYDGVHYEVGGHRVAAETILRHIGGSVASN